MSFNKDDKVAWADPLPNEQAWKAEQRKKWEAEFGPPPYTVTHTCDFRPGEDLVYVEEFYETLASAFDKSGFTRSPRGLVQGWFKLWEK